MPVEQPDNSAGRKVELAVGQCESISILPSVAARFLSQLGRMELTPGGLSELVESDPAITALLLRLCQSKGITIKQCDTWLLQVMENISLREIRDAILSTKVLGALSDDGGTDFRKELTRHSLATACCAKQLAKLVSPPIDGDAAYLVGLLHDIGKFLLDETMPKSFDTLLEQAKTGRTSFYRVEQDNLGTDHTILGKRFAQKLHLPSDIILGLWLHHSRAGAIPQMPQARLAGLVELSDVMVRRMNIGESGSYEDQLSAEAIAGTLGLNPGHLQQVQPQLLDIIAAKSEAVGLNILKPAWAYCDALRTTAEQLAADSSKLFEESSRLQNNVGIFDFIKDLTPKISSSMTAPELAEDFAVVWQKFYHTGPVCVYLAGQGESDFVEAAIVDEQGKSKTIVLEADADEVSIPKQLQEKFAVIDAGDNVNWLLKQVDVKFDLGRTKIAPLQSDGKTSGIIIFELRHPVSGDIAERIGPALRFGGAILDILGTIGSQQWYAERFASALSQTPDTGPQTPDLKPGSPVANQVSRLSGTPDKDIRVQAEADAPSTDSGQATALAEMAAGAAHELNNPLSVISGRAQLLAKSEADPEKKRILEQIQQNAGELSSIIDDLMSYANPESPRPTSTPIKQIIDEAADLAMMKKKLRKLDAEITVAADTPNVFADSAQIASAISNIICNGLESYAGENGAITIKARADKEGGMVSVQIIDSGRGMDAQTLAKAMHPFFSAKQAGRKRGMGLAHAQRLIEINHGKLSIASQQEKGTTATIALPVARDPKSD